MEAAKVRKLESKLRKFLDEMTQGMGRRERRVAMGLYVKGLLLDGERKSVAPMAARLVQDPSKADAMRQRLHECVAVSDWDQDELRRRLALHAESMYPGMQAFIVDDTGFAKKGTHSVGVARQYSGTMGRVDNCQVAPSLHLAGPTTSVSIGMEMYLPEEWSNDDKRRAKVGIPAEIVFRTKWQIALELIDRALSWGLPKRVVLADAGYGDVTAFRRELIARGLPYAVGVQGGLKVWRPGEGPEPPPPPQPGTPGRPRSRWKTTVHQPVTVKELACELGAKGRRTVTWREGTKGAKKSRFGFVRVRTAHGHSKGKPPGDEEWFVYEWPSGADAPARYWLAALPATMTKRKLVRTIKLRWRVERDYQDMKGEVGLDHFEGRGWRAFHHHAIFCSLAHAFLALYGALSPLKTDRGARGGSPTISVLRSILQMVLIRLLGLCPMCRRPATSRSPPLGASRI